LEAPGEAARTIGGRPRRGKTAWRFPSPLGRD